MRARAARLPQRRHVRRDPTPASSSSSSLPHTPHAIPYTPHNDNDDAKMAAPEYAADLKFIKLSIPFPHVLHVELAR